MAHPKLMRTVATTGLTAALLTLPLSASAFALGAEDTVAPVAAEAEATLPALVAEAVDQAASPLRNAVAEQAAPAVDEAVNSAPAPVREAAGKVSPSQPSSPAAPVPGPAAGPRGDRVEPVGDRVPVPSAAQGGTPSRDASWHRARQALLAQPMSTTPFPQLAELLGTDLPMTAGEEIAQASRTVSEAAGGAPGWLIATATGMLVLLGAAHIAYADGRLSRASA